MLSWLSTPLARRLAWLAVALVMGAAFVATHLPPRSIPHGPPGSDKTAHFVLYFIIGSGLTIALATSRPPMKAALLALLLAAGFGIADELTQIPVGRHADLFDWLFDVLGAACGAGGVGLLATLLPQRRRQPES